MEVAPNKTDLMTTAEVIQEFFLRQPASSPEARATIENEIKEYHTKKMFTGTIHAEATLMGLLSYFSHDSSVNYGGRIEDIGLLNEFIRPVRYFQLSFPPPLYTHPLMKATVEKSIAVSTKKCCWCCNKLGSLLGDVKLPGSHGVLCSWTPPRMGIDITLLQALEDSLWKELEAAIGNTLSLVPSRQRSGSSTILESEDILVMGKKSKVRQYKYQKSP